MAKGVGNPGHLIAGGSLVLAGERTCPVPSLQDVAPSLFLPSFHQVTGLECPPRAIQVMVEFMIKSRCWVSDCDKVTLWELRSPGSPHQPHTFPLGKAPTSGCDRSDASRDLGGGNFFIGP